MLEGGGGERDEVGLDYMKSKGTRNGLREREWGVGKFYNDWSNPNRGGAR